MNPEDANETPSEAYEPPETQTAPEENAPSQNKEQVSGRMPKPITISDIEYEQLKAQGNEFKDKYVRLLAEQENMRKRLQKECEQKTQYAVQNAISDFLAPLDHLENALKFTEQMSEEIKHWGIGFQMILGQFKEALSSNGIYPIESIGKQMDPNFHDVIEAIPNDNYVSGTIIEEVTKGYIMKGDIVIRPARVKVAKSENKS